MMIRFDSMPCDEPLAIKIIMEINIFCDNIRIGSNFFSILNEKPQVAIIIVVSNDLWYESGLANWQMISRIKSEIEFNKDNNDSNITWLFNVRKHSFLNLFGIQH